MKNRVLMLLDNPFTNDRRVKREALALIEKGYKVQIICTKEKNLPEKEIEERIEIFRLLDLAIFDPKKVFEHKKWAKKIIESFEFDILHAHDQTMLNMGALIKKMIPAVPFIYDSHELFHSWPINSSNFESKLLMIKSVLVRKYFIKRELSNSKYIDHLVTVNKSLADNLKDYFNLNKSITVIRNCPEFAITHTKTNILRDKFNIPSEKKILVFIGANIYLNSLNMEQVFQEFKNRTDIEVVVISSFNDHSRQVMKYVENNGIKNVHFHDKVKPEQINEYLSSADVGVVPTWNKSDLSYWYALDNKLFEYIQARIPVLATAQPEYVNIIEAENCGVCIDADQKDAYINGFDKIISNYEFYHKNTETAAKNLSWENEKVHIQNLYNRIANA